MVGRVIVLVALASCGRGPARPSAPGSTQATAIPLALSIDADATQPGTLTGDRERALLARGQRHHVTVTRIAQRDEAQPPRAYHQHYCDVYARLTDRFGTARVDTSAIDEGEGVRQSVAILREWIDAAG